MHYVCHLTTISVLRKDHSSTSKKQLILVPHDYKMLHDLTMESKQPTLEPAK